MKRKATQTTEADIKGGRVERIEVGQLWRNNDDPKRGGGTIKKVVKVDGAKATLLSEFGRMSVVTISMFIARQNHANGYTFVGMGGIAWPG
jgi:hypothetical protein